MSWQPQASIQALHARAKLYQEIRSFFNSRDVLEVETPQLNTHAVTDLQIESINTDYGYLHTSPEYAMKRLITFHRKDIYQLCKVFRAEEQGRLHHYEFTMLEWYRVAWNYLDLMQEVEALIRSVMPASTLQESVYLTYQQAFKNYASIDIFQAGPAEYLQCCSDCGITLNSSLSIQQYQEFVLDQIIIPKFEKQKIYFIHEYPQDQAALARINAQGLAERFECFLNGLEIANGFQELTDASEQLARFEEDNRQRLLANKKAIKIDSEFIAALEAGLPESTGVAVGVDRLLMTILGVEDIGEVLSFS